MTVERILRSKGREVVTIQSNATVADVVDSLQTRHIGALVVSDDGSEITGVISERDIVRGLKQHGAGALELPVGALMAADVVTCAPDDRIAGIMAIMTERRVRHLPVVADGRLAGIISIGDVVNCRLDDLQAKVEAMSDYITRT